MSEPVSISRVTRDGQVERLGQWLHEERVLELERAGFPFLGPGRHQLEGELPWIFWDMCPSGYLGRRLMRQRPELRLPENPRDWMAKDILYSLTHIGSDLAGNLLVGDESVRQFREYQFSATDLVTAFTDALKEGALSGSPSSLGGERPKILYADENGAILMKFSPPQDTPQGQRWCDLLRLEAMCADALRKNGVRAAMSFATRRFERTILSVSRFDRVRVRGRVGVGTLYFLAMERWGEMAISAPEVLNKLHGEGAIDAASVETCTRVHAFSAAIGNNDAHLGNYALLFDDAGRATLAPIYDVLPMVFAPRNDELPDQWITPRATPIDPAVAPWVDALVRAVETEPEISQGFKDLWRRYVGV